MNSTDIIRRIPFVAFLALACAEGATRPEDASSAATDEGPVPTSSTDGSAEATPPVTPSSIETPTMPSAAPATPEQPANSDECGSGVVEAGFVEVDASDPAIRYVGRFDFENVDAPRMAFPAVMIETRFEGDAIDLRLDEDAPGTSATSTQYYEVRIDDMPAVTLETCPQQEVYPLARGLSEGEHSVRVAKRTEASVGSAAFLGFRVREGTALSLPDAPSRRLEVVGDSITCGYGNEVSTTTPDDYPFTSANENALLAYGAVAAEALDADYVAVAASGRGMVRNYGGGSGALAPEFYELVTPERGTAGWDHTRYTPDVVVTNLGTNDFSIGLDAAELEAMREEYRQAYAAFLVRLRELHPAATLIAAVGPMMSDSYPPDYQALTSVRSDVRSAVDGRVADGDENVFFFEFSAQSSPYGEDWHPTVATHQRMADSLVAFVQETLGW